MLTLLGALLIQIGTNICNDYYDFLKGADTPERVGPLRVTQAGLLKPEQVKMGFVLVFALAICVGFALILRGGWPIVMIGLTSITSGIFYTASPYALAYLGLGEVFVLIFYGPVAVAGTYYVQTLRFSWIACLYGLAIGFLISAVLMVNSWRDMEQDRKAGKKTPAVRFGKDFARQSYIFSLLASAGIAFALGAWPSALLVLAVAFLPKKNLNRLLAQTAFSAVIFALLAFF